MNQNGRLDDDKNALLEIETIALVTCQNPLVYLSEL
jgi:hypothetical protein